MSEKRPRVSIGMPVYNGEPYLREALDSLLAQDFSDFELVISDNASTDGTLQLLQDYASRDPRIRLYCNKINIGPAQNFQRVLELSTGEYFLWASADDRWSPNFVSALVETLDSEKHVLLACPTGVYVDINGNDLQDREDRPPSAGASRFKTAKLFLDQHACTWLHGLCRRERLLSAAPVFWAQRWWSGDAVFLFYLSLNYPLAGNPESRIYKRIGSGAPVAPRSRKQRARWQVWYTRQMMGVALASALPAPEKLKLLFILVLYLRRIFGGLINCGITWLRALGEILCQKPE